MTEHAMDDDLQAYVDGRLSEDRHAAVEARLARDPVQAAEVEALKVQNETLRGLYAHVGREEIPARLSPYRIDARLRQGRTQVWRMAAAAALLVAAGIAAGWIGRAYLAGQRPNVSLVGEAMAAHSLYTREVRHAVEVKADQEEHLTTWLSNRLDRTLIIPDLRQDGMTFVGGRLLPAAEGPAAQLMYEDASGKRVTLYVVPSAQATETSLRYMAANDLQSFLWSDNSLDCALTGDLPRAQLQKIAMSAYEQFE